ncbi:hypothetical protein E1B28_012585 [Marasmius oreades]|uniref:Nucleolar protein 12 n=1 Tax=Marasmius oreades TaxID=181124 RepID=A0A9P7RSU6_9AGAR|nr:uncharacterized protein E1B28_012585 [Marasmius oreades]KAG7088611.1 hypothetical protein E1B28_012585 [Marasmius oreades]
MALSSLLLAGNKSSIDKELDSLFKTNVPVSRPQLTPNNTSVSANTPSLKRKNGSDDTQDAKSPSKRVKGGVTITTTKKEKKAIVTENEKSKRKVKASGKQKRNVRDSEGISSEGDEVHDVGSDDEDKSDLENAYLKRTLAGNQGKQKAQQGDSEDEDEDEGEVIEDADSESDSDTLPPQHESLSKSSKRTKQKSVPKVKYVPAYETPEQRHARTIFVGNLAVEIAQKKPLRKQLQRHILSLIPTTTPGPKPKVESIRFRSVPFATPTSTLPEDEDNSKAKGKAKRKEPSRQHDLDRTSNWRGKNADGETEKKFLTPAQKKKVAFITQEFHSSANNMHAYIVFAHPPPLDEASSSDAKRKSKLPPPPAVMDPYEAARLAKEACDGTMFMDRAIRVDVAAKNASAAAVNTEGRVVKTDVDPKKCVFVGNLDFQSREEDLRVFFEGVISSEKGPRSTDSDDNEDDSELEGKGQTRAQPRNWVKRVRIIRDKDTQLGKGFAYIQFINHECVDEILALEPSKLKFAKRKLRVERCKTLPGVSMKLSSKPKSSVKSSKPSRPTPVSVPQGDPSLGEKLAHLSKEDRKKVKATDPERLARRLAKKKARMTLATPRKDSEGIKMAGKDRDRERKTGAAKGKGKHGTGSATKGRVRSEKSTAKRNAKK